MLIHAVAFLSGDESLFDFERVVPMPSGLAGMDLIVWATAHRGEYQAYNVTLSTLQGGGVQYQFMTAGGAPHGIYLRLLELFPTLTIRWFHDSHENGRGFLSRKRSCAAQRKWRAFAQLTISTKWFEECSCGVAPCRSSAAQARRADRSLCASVTEPRGETTTSCPGS